MSGLWTLWLLFEQKALAGTVFATFQFEKRDYWLYYNVLESLSAENEEGTVFKIFNVFSVSGVDTNFLCRERLVPEPCSGL